MSEVDVAKFYTRARRFPQLLGTTPDGKKLPGGPYTLTQFSGAGVALLLLAGTRGVWAQYGFAANITIFVVVMVGVVIGLGRIPLGSRSPLSVLLGIGTALCSPRGGRINGRTVRIRPPHTVTRRTVVAGPPAPDAEPDLEVAPVAPAAPAPTAAVPAAPETPAELAPALRPLFDDPIRAEAVVAASATPADAAPLVEPAPEPTDADVAGPAAPLPSRPARPARPARRPRRPATPAPAAAAAAEPAAAPAHPGTPAVTGVQALLAMVGAAPRSTPEEH